MIHRIAIFLGFCLAFPPGAHAQFSDLRCDDRVRLTQTLENVQGAERHGMGLRDPETMLEVWVIARNGEWVIVQNYANGTACIVAMGEHWEDTPADPA